MHGFLQCYFAKKYFYYKFIIKYTITAIYVQLHWNVTILILRPDFQFLIKQFLFFLIHVLILFLFAAIIIMRSLSEAFNVLMFAKLAVLCITCIVNSWCHNPVLIIEMNMFATLCRKKAWNWLSIAIIMKIISDYIVLMWPYFMDLIRKAV